MDGAYAFGASNEPVLNRLEIHAKAGFEAFYTTALTPWLQRWAERIWIFNR